MASNESLRRGIECGRRAAAVALVLASAFATGGSAAIFRVGSDASCTQTTIAAALLGAALNGVDDEILIARNQTYTNQYLHLTSFPNVLVLRGGYDNCADTTPNGTTVVNGRTNEPVVEVDGTTASDVRITGLGLVTPSGGTTEAVRVHEMGRLLVDSSTISGGQAGGLTVQGADAFAELGFSAFVLGNSGFSGGGLVCGLGGTLRLAGVVQQNQATANGGGIFAVENCQVALLNGAYVVENDAGFDGGGIYLGSGADLVATGGAGVGLVVSGNVAGGEGGGVFAHMAGTTANIRNTWITANTAETSGGGIYALNQAAVVMDRIIGPCADDVRCVRLSGNLLVSGTDGAAAAALGGATVTLNQTFVEANAVPEPEPFGSILFVSGAASQLKTESVQLWGNTGADAVFESQFDALAWATYTTAGRNEWNDGGTFREAGGFFLGNDGDGRINTSVFWPTAGHEVSTATGSLFTQVDCLVTSTMTGLPASAEFVALVDPMYEDLIGGDLRPQPGSPVVDFCDIFRYEPQHADILSEARSHDHPINPNGFPGVAGGIYDAGAYEQWELFADGFETGDTTRWSSTAP